MTTLSSSPDRLNRTKRRPSFMTGTAALVGILFAVNAHGDELTAAETLFNEGRAALAAQHYDTACAKFRESDRLDPAVGTHLNLANCEEQRDHVASARVLFAEALAQLPSDDPRSAVAKARMQALDARVPRLTIRSQSPLPMGTELAIAGSSLDLATARMPLMLDPGTYQLLVSVPKRRVATYSVELREGQTVDFVIPVPDGESKPSAARHTEAQRDHGWTSLQWTGAGAVAGGAVALGIGGYFLLGALSKDSDSSHDCTGDVCGPQGYSDRSTAVSRGNSATALAVVGTVLVGGGVALWIVGHDDARVQKASATSNFALSAAPMGLGGQLLGRF
jgi:hypothetical protein